MPTQSAPFRRGPAVGPFVRFPVFLLALLVATPATFADEGMWLPHQLNEIAGPLKAEGLEIPVNELADLLDHPMNAIISLGGCTASFVSPQGLVVTNYHCAYRALQFNSTPESNLIEDGFLAQALADEIPAGPGSRIFVTVDFDEVTDEITGDLGDLDGAERYDAIEEKRKAMVTECEKDEGHRCRVASFYGGLEHYRIKQLEIRDVRIVYAPKSAIGIYGGEIDNWEWPRHTGDFAFYRAYVGSDGKPADPDDANIPYRPKHHLEVAAGGVDEGDFVMVTGYPGGTNRYRTAREVEEQFEKRYPERVESSRDQLRIIEEATADHPDDEIRYAGQVAGLNNGMKNNEGMIAGYQGSDMLERKQKLEAELRQWIEADAERREHYGSALDQLEAVIEEGYQVSETQGSFRQASTGSALDTAAAALYRLAHERQKPDAERDSFFQDRNRPRFEAFMQRIDRTFSPRVDRELWLYDLRRYVEDEDAERVAAFDELMGLAETFDAEATGKKIDAMYEKTVLTDSAKRLELLDATPEQIEAMDDPFLQKAVALYERSRQREEEAEARSGRLERLRPLYMQAMLAYLGSQGRKIYPDANSTLRVTYGQVTGYSPRDAVRYAPFTTPRGLLEKESGEEPFASPPELLEAVKANSFGSYADAELGTLPVNFLADLDITGGNSGSPTLDARGNLVGLVFDGNFESIISDWDFRPEITRSIHVDIRYILWVMDHLDGADHLVEEMGLEATPDAAPAEERAVAAAAP